MTAIVSIKNEQAALPECLESLKNFTQVVVVDSASTDDSVSIALSHGVQVVPFNWNGKYPKKKQWCLENLDLANEWILFVDGDERATPELEKELTNIAMRRGGPSAYDVPLDYWWRGRKLDHGYTVHKRVLARAKHLKFPEFDDLRAPGMGELEGHYQPEVRGSLGTTLSRLQHHDPDPIATWIDRHNRYSDWEATIRQDPQLYKEVERHRSPQGRVFSRSPFKPLAFFVYSYVYRRGFLDGRAGLEYAGLLAWYYWLVGIKVRDLTKDRSARITHHK